MNRLLVSTATDSSMVILPFSVTVGARELRLFMNVQKIAKVAEYVGLTPLAADMRPFIGLYDFDGAPIPVLDLRAYFERNPPEGEEDVAAAATQPVDRRQTAPGRRLLVCNTMDVRVGLIVDRTRKVEALVNADIKAPPSLIAQGVFCAVVRDDTGFRYLLDIESLLEKEGVSVGRHAAYESSNTALLKGRRILFVDDSRFFQTLGRKLLEKFAAEVDVAGDGAEGLTKYTAHPERYDLILTDIEMPIMSGIEMARAVRKTAAGQVPIVFHSSISNAALIEDLKTQGLGDYIVKFDEKSVIEAMIRHLHKS